MRVLKIRHPRLGAATCMPSALSVWLARGWTVAEANLAADLVAPVAPVATAPSLVKRVPPRSPRSPRPPVDAGQRMDPDDGDAEGEES